MPFRRAERARPARDTHRERRNKVRDLTSDVNKGEGVARKEREDGQDDWGGGVNSKWSTVRLVNDEKAERGWYCQNREESLKLH